MRKILLEKVGNVFLNGDALSRDTPVKINKRYSN